MSPKDEVALTKKCERLQRKLRGIDVQVDYLKQRLAKLSTAQGETEANNRIGDEGLAAFVEALIPSIREAVREELKVLKPLDEAWYSPSEVEALSCGRVRADTVRKWLHWDQIDGESDGRQIRIFQRTVDELRKNKWRPLRGPDPAKLPPSCRKSDSC